MAEPTLMPVAKFWREKLHQQVALGTLYRAIASGKIPVVKVGRRYLIPESVADGRAAVVEADISPGSAKE